MNVNDLRYKHLQQKHGELRLLNAAGIERALNVAEERDSCAQCAFLLDATFPASKMLHHDDCTMVNSTICNCI